MNGDECWWSWSTYGMLMVMIIDIHYWSSIAMIDDLPLLWLPSGKRLHNELERSTIFNGYINYFDWAIFNSYVK